MSQTNIGGQLVGWKFSTPLKADELNTFFSGTSNPGLITRPYFEYGAGNTSSVDVSINPFSMFVVPYDKYNPYKDENGKYPNLRMVKITTTTIVPITVASTDIAIGFRYSFANPDTRIPQAQWYGEFVSLDINDLATFMTDPETGRPQGIIIATVQYYNNGTNSFYSITTNGADISDILLREEGWNPRCWLSVVHPSRAVGGKYNRLEVRCHNDLYEGFINGNSGCVRLNNCQYDLDKTLSPSEDPELNKDGTRGFMPSHYNCFSLQSRGFYLADQTNTSPFTTPIVHTHGGIFAMVNAYETNYGIHIADGNGMGGDSKSFTNKLKIYPVKQEDINIYYNNNTLTIN